MKKCLSVLISFLMILSLAGCSSNTTSTSGTYEGVSENGKGGEVKVSITVTDGNIDSVEVTEHNETAGISDPAIEKIPEEIVEYQSLAIDAVSGATITSNAILEAVADAANNAGLDVDALKNKTVEKELSTEVKDLEAEVVVVGAGASGVFAAMSAAYEGAESIILLEKEASIGGNAIVSGGYCEITDTTLFPDNNDGYTKAMEDFLAAGPQNDSEAAVWDELTKEYEDYKASGSTKVFDSDLYHAIDFARIENYEFAGTKYTTLLSDFVSWFNDETGAKWRNTAGIVGYTWPRWSSLDGYYSGKGYFDYYQKWVEDNNAPIETYTSTPMTDLIVDEEGKVTGVVAVNEDGTTYNITADKGVILCTGGFSANLDMVVEYDDTWGDLISVDTPTTNSAGDTGDGIVIAEKYGAMSASLGNTMLFPLANIHTGSTESIVGTTASALLVNAEGNRFVDETLDRYSISGAILSQTNQVAYLISSEANSMNDGDKTQGGEDIETLIKNGELYRADTIDELAEITGIDAENLKATIADYNTMCETYEDKEFGRTTFAEGSAINDEDGPFYAYPCTAATHISIGGLVCDDYNRVLNTEGEVIPGLYAAGELMVGECGIDSAFAYGKYVGKVVALGLDKE